MPQLDLFSLFGSDMPAEKPARKDNASKKEKKSEAKAAETLQPGEIFAEHSVDNTTEDLSSDESQTLPDLLTIEITEEAEVDEQAPIVVDEEVLALDETIQLPEAVIEPEVIDVDFLLTEETQENLTTQVDVELNNITSESENFVSNNSITLPDISNIEPAIKLKSEAKEKQQKEIIKTLPQKRGRKSFKEIEAEADLIEIPSDEILNQKMYYSISDVAKWFNVNTSLLRFWENEFDILKPRKNRKGDRLFRPEDIKNLQLIYHLLRERKYTIEGAKEYIKAHKKKADLQLQLTHTLQKFKGFLLELKANLQS